MNVSFKEPITHMISLNELVNYFYALWSSEHSTQKYDVEFDDKIATFSFLFPNDVILGI